MSAFLVGTKFRRFHLWKAWQLRNATGRRRSNRGFVSWGGDWPLCPIKFSPRCILPLLCSALQLAQEFLAPRVNAFNSAVSLRRESNLVAPWQRWNKSVMQQNIFEMLILATCNLILFFFLLPFFYDISQSHSLNRWICIVKMTQRWLKKASQSEWNGWSALRVAV